MVKSCVGILREPESGNTVLRDGCGGNKISGWRWACIELRKMANRASIGKVSQRG